MSILVLLVPLSLVLLLLAIGMFVWAVRKGQFENLDSAALDVLMDDPPAPDANAAQGTAPADHAD